MITLKHKATIKNGIIIPSDHKRFLADLRQYEGKDVWIEIKKFTRTRSNLQNRSLHLYFTQLAEALNLVGGDMRKVISKEVDIEWTGLSIKEYLWRPLQHEMFQKKSTTQLTSEDINQIYDNVNRIIGERTGVFVPWPCLDAMFEG